MITPHPIDVQVGRALRRERKAAGWSQQRLATALGVSFQQLQKYERGANRISGSKIHEVCKALDILVSVLFDEAAPAEAAVSAEERRIGQLISALSPGHRRTVMDMVEALHAQQTA